MANTSHKERLSKETPLLVQLLTQRSSDTVEDVCEHLALSTTVAEFLVDYTRMPDGKPQPIKVFSAGTNIRDVDIIDRGQKMIFTCEQHPDTRVWASKYPPSSQWFPASGKEPRDCGCSQADPVWVLVVDYKPTRND